MCLTSFYNIVEKHLCIYVGEDVNEMQILSMLKSKLPSNVLFKLEKMKSENEYHKNLQKTVEKTHQTSTSLQHSDEVVS